MSRRDNVRLVTVLEEERDAANRLINARDGRHNVQGSLLSSPSAVEVVPDVGENRFMDTACDERPRPVWLSKPPVYSMHYTAPEDVQIPPGSDGRDFWINVIEPLKAHLVSEPTSSLHISDGALIVVDCLEGVGFQTEPLIWRALAERIKLVLVLNNVDSLFAVEHDPEKVYRTLTQSIDTVNAIIGACTDNFVMCESDTRASPDKGNVVFASAEQGWAFTLMDFAKLYASRHGISTEEMMHRLWGDNFYDPVSLKWKTEPTGEGGKLLPRSFCQLVIDPVCKLCEALMAGDDKAKCNSMLSQLGICLKETEMCLVTQQALVKRVMGKWLPINTALLEVVIAHLPSPVVAQQYRVESLYTGSMNDPVAQSMRACDPHGPLLVYVSRFVPLSYRGRFLALCRVFSGTFDDTVTVRIMGPNYLPGKKDCLFRKTLQRPFIITEGSCEQLPACPCGSVIGIIGLDPFLLESGTISDSEEANRIMDMKLCLTPTVKVKIEAKNYADLPRLVEGCKILTRKDPQCKHDVDDQSGDRVISCVSELHLESCLQDLSEITRAIPLQVGAPYTSLRETIMTDSQQECISRSPNRNNRLYMKAEALGNDLTNLLESRTPGNSNVDPRILACTLVEQFKWDPIDTCKLWCFGPDDIGPNVLVDMTEGVPLIKEIKDSMTRAFQWAMKEGPLCGEPVRGVRINFRNATLHLDTIHRGVGQIVPTSRKCFYACILTASPAVLEPIYLMEVQCRDTSLTDLYAVIMKRRGQIISEDHRLGSRSLSVVRFHIPVMESFGLTAELRTCFRSSGCDVVQTAFDHWSMLPGNPYDATTLCGRHVSQIRLRKTLPESIPEIDSFVDKP
ncbi:elongation factor 2 [Pelomyxa schiedti]|nr:elongation factor 2 [Pelomyxa schiedti]